MRRLYYKVKFSNLTIRPNTSDFKVFEQIFLFKEYDVEVPFLPKLIIDAGANVGYGSIYFSEKFPSSMIIALEPEESNYNVLISNIKNYSKIIPLQKGLWHENTKLFIDNIDDNKWSFELTTVKKENDTTITTCTVDELIKKYGQIDMLKMDIEGAEKEVFSNSTDWLSSVKMLIVETHDSKKPGCSQSLFNAVARHNFSHYRHGENEIFVNSLI